jgi:membrane-associated phospholipid phosphatase
MSAPLISPAWRTPALWACAVAAIGFALLAAVVADDHSTAFDDWMFRTLFVHTGNAFATLTLAVSNAAVSIFICGLIVVVAAVARRWDVVVLASAGPAGTVLLTRYVFKPLLSRVLSTDDVYHALRGLVPPGESFSVTGAFPSGHESAVASTAWVLIIVCCQASISRRLRAVLLTLIAAWALISAIGLVRNFWHYATDTIGAMCLATVVVVGLALVIDRHFATVQRRLGARGGTRDQLTRRS